MGVAWEGRAQDVLQSVTPELVADFHWRHLGVARHIQTVDFNLIKFRPILSNTALRHHF